MISVVEPVSCPGCAVFGVLYWELVFAGNYCASLLVFTAATAAGVSDFSRELSLNRL